ncbi:MAG: phosphate/phosphite/phosphonate ABC transporter substrate-binding protein [Deltaproteobacteria bacterium]|nr:phosphate/phosphite/phosphonate ABC transporter substrate-binding protein [Deltaproteobacteria bacterium]
MGITLVHAEKCEQPQSLRFSRIPTGNVDNDSTRFRSLFTRLEQLTGLPVVMVRANSYAAVVEGILGGHVDIAELGPATYTEARNNDNQITPFATVERNAGIYQTKGSYYRSLLVALASKGYSDIAALKKTRLMLTDPGSTSGSLLPRKQFTPGLGAPFEKHFSTVSFSGSHAKSIQALIQGKADVAFVSSALLEDAHLTNTLPANKVRILWKSDLIPYDPFVYRGQLCSSLRKQIREAFLGSAASTELRDLLVALKAERFVATDDSQYAGIRKLLEN